LRRVSEEEEEKHTHTHKSFADDERDQILMETKQEIHTFHDAGDRYTLRRFSVISVFLR
jgi:hypothetical protein